MARMFLFKNFKMSVVVIFANIYASIHLVK